MNQILLAEDDAHIAKLISFKLGRDGFQVTVAQDGQQAIDLLTAQQWALVILDVMMPLKTGWDVLRAIRGSDNEQLKSVKVLMLTAKGSAKDVTDASELGADQYLKKPFDPAELSRTVRLLV